MLINGGNIATIFYFIRRTSGGSFATIFIPFQEQYEYNTKKFL